MPVFGGNAFGVKLHANGWEGPAWRNPCTWPSSLVALTIRQSGTSVHDQAMVSCCGEGGGQAGEQAGAVVADRRRLAMHQPAAHHAPRRNVAQSFGDQGTRRAKGLRASAQAATRSRHDARLIRGARAGGEQERLGPACQCIGGSQRVVPNDLNFGALTP